MLQHQYQEVVPTVGFKVEQFQKNNIEFTMFDMSGASTHRDLWATYYKECDAVVYVIDCKDKLRVCVAEQELSEMLAHTGALAAGSRRSAPVLAQPPSLPACFWVSLWQVACA